jgi:cystathionine beta-lyase/cystathionine gamma-synthase
MSAIDTALSVFHRGSLTRPWLFFSEIYGGTISYIESILKARRGVQAHSFLPDGERYDLEAFERILKEINPEVVYIEAISNPMLIVTDLEHVIKASRKNNSAVIVDNTFSTPLLCRPLEMGADLVIHSATKYFSGHGNITAGVVCGNDTTLMRSALEYRKFVGHMISPDDAYRLNTQIKTFPLRFRQQCLNAELLTRLLGTVSVVEKVWFPGLAGHATHAEAVRLFGNKGFGAMVTFGFAGSTAEEKKKRRDTFIKAVSGHIKVIPSLGDPDTILMPVESVWGAKYPEPGIIRLSAGFEDSVHLEKTILKALEITAAG